MTEFCVTDVSQADCVVCSEKTRFRNNCICKVAMCTTCLTKWLGRKRQCPHCQQDLMPFDEWNDHWKDEKMRDDLDEDNFYREIGIPTALAMIMTLSHTPCSSEKVSFIVNRLFDICYMLDRAEDFEHFSQRTSF